MIILTHNEADSNTLILCCIFHPWSYLAADEWGNKSIDVLFSSYKTFEPTLNSSHCKEEIIFL